MVLKILKNKHVSKLLKDTNILKLIKNKYVFYVIFILAVFNLLGYLAAEEYESLVLFIMIYVLSSHFSKNTIIKLAVSILGTSLARSFNRRKLWPWKEREGLEVEKEDIDMEEEEKDMEEDEMDMEKVLSEAAPKGMKPMKKKKVEKEKFQSASMPLKGSPIVGGGMKLGSSEDLQKSMDQLAPLLESAERLLNTFEKSGIMGMADGLMGKLGSPVS
tara:strand:+ start:1081 stop:1731 length:651 start_codon:yes stop_codon:yes gene_type:complete